MPESAVSDFLTLKQPGDIPGLVAFWHFTGSEEYFAPAQGGGAGLRSQSGRLEVVRDPAAPLGGTALDLQEGEWLSIPRCDCRALDFSGDRSALTVMAWIQRQPTRHKGCEFIAGMWNETQCGRQYGLFLNIGVWKQDDQVCGHLSRGGGATPGYMYCMDGPVGATRVPRGEWSVVGMSYDGLAGYAWLNGTLDCRPGLNPYSLAGGLYEGGEGGSDFTVGAVDRSSEVGNFFAGKIAGIAVYNRALTPAEVFALSRI